YGAIEPQNFRSGHASKTARTEARNRRYQFRYPDASDSDTAIRLLGDNTYPARSTIRELADVQVSHNPHTFLVTSRSCLHATSELPLALWQDRAIPAAAGGRVAVGQEQPAGNAFGNQRVDALGQALARLARRVLDLHQLRFLRSHQRVDACPAGRIG